jgi:hypothetical protein
MHVVDQSSVRAGRACSASHVCACTTFAAGSVAAHSQLKKVVIALFCVISSC